ncbi:MAG TPA: nitrogenase molybdenum-iron protein subunit beta [Armatimonadota bacterium]|jgi:nitrogenase molybdenum-iron protein beta chain
MLDLTPRGVVERHALRVNPAKTCQPIGALYAALGIHRCLPHSHGSQGCCAYHRSHLTRHFKEPVMASTSSFTEGSSVFGGSANLTQAIHNIFAIYQPDVIAVHTTCLSETIGDDIPTIVAKAREEGLIPAGKRVFHANTPSYVGSHVTGFSNMTKAMVTAFAESSGSALNQVNLVPGFVDPSDMRELRRIASAMGISTVLFPDTSDVLDTPQTGHYAFYPKGGVTLEQLKSTGDSVATVALGPFASEEAAVALDNAYQVPCEVLELPLGLRATDRLLHALRDIAAKDVPAALMDERGRLLDAMIDTNQYLHGKRVAVFGDPDHVTALTEFLVDLGMRPIHVLTGTPGGRFERRVREILKPVCPDANVRAAADLFLLHQWLKDQPVDLLVGNSYGKFIARAEDVPYVRFGFPILDRIGHSYFPSVGYLGGLRLLERLLCALQDRQDRDCPDERLELVM